MLGQEHIPLKSDSKKDWPVRGVPNVSKIFPTMGTCKSRTSNDSRQSGGTTLEQLHLRESDPLLDLASDSVKTCNLFEVEVELRDMLAKSRIFRKSLSLPGAVKGLQSYF